MDFLQIRARMLKIMPTAKCAINFDSEDTVTLTWVWMEKDCYSDMVERTHSITVSIHYIDTNSRTFEREMHQATRVIKHGRRKDG